jgi:2'-5' RNA ligase
MVAMPRERVGVALLFDAPATAAVDTLRRALGADDVERLPAHLTLVPPVNVRLDELDDAFDLLRDAAHRTEPFRLQLGPARTFLPINPVLYLEVGGEVRSVDLLRDRIFRPPLERNLTWPFQPHVTILDGGDESRIRAAVEALADVRIEVDITQVHLLKEHNDEGVRSWRPIFEATLGEPGVVGRGGLELELEVGEKPYAGRSLGVTARRGDRTVGTATGWTDGEQARLLDVHVDVGARREGVGAHLVAAFASAAAARGASHLDAVDHPFLERVGFVDGRRAL